MIILSSITCISAAPINENADTSSVKINDEIGNFSNLDNEISKSIGLKTLNLTKDYIFDPSTDEQYIDGITINADNLTIDGKGHIIDAKNQAKVFNIKSENVILKSINIINGYSNTDGGSLYWSGTNGTIINSTFKDCYTSKYGGAVSFRWGGTVLNSYFENNKAGTGGGVDFEGIATIINSTFKNNSAKFQGGAVSFYGLSSVKKTTFINNTGGDGGTIYAESECLVEDSVFLQNFAIGYGAGIYFMTSGSVMNSSFTQNTALLEGSAILIKTGDLKIFNTNFNYNVANKGYSIYILSENAELENLSFYSEATNFSSEIYVENTKLNSNNLTFINNTKTITAEPQKVIKKKTAIKCSSKTFKSRNKNKKYVVALKSGKTLLKSKKIKLTINKKVYSKKTNSKGKVTFKIKLSKKGKYKAIIRFGGDKLYKSSKKIVKIKIK